MGYFFLLSDSENTLYWKVRGVYSKRINNLQTTRGICVHRISSNCAIAFFVIFVFRRRTMVEKSQEYRLECWATRSSIRPFIHTAHLFACIALLASLARSTALTCLLFWSLRSWESECYFLSFFFSFCTIVLWSTRIENTCICCFCFRNDCYSRNGSQPNFKLDLIWFFYRILFIADDVKSCLFECP